MPIAVTCAGCGKTLKVKDEWAGKKGKCPTCGTTFAIPAAGQVSKAAWGATSAAAQDKKNAKKTGAPVQVSAGLIIGVVVLALIVIAGIMFVTGPKRVWSEWEALGAKPNDAVESVISRGLQAYLSQIGEYNPSKAHQTPGVQGDILFYRPTMVMKMPDAVDFQGASTTGEFHGKYHPATGEVEADVDTGPNQRKQGLGEVKGTAPKIKVTGRVKNGVVSAEVNGKNAEIVYPKNPDND